MQPGNRYYLFKDLIRCNCLDVLQTIKFLTLLYTARGFLSFCLPWGLNPSPSRGSSSAWAGGCSQAPLQSPAAMQSEQQPCRQLPACSLAVQRMLSRERDVPLAILSAKDHPCCPESLLAPSWEDLQPSLNSAGLGARAPAEDGFLLWLCPSRSAPFSPRFHLLTWHWENIES